MRRITETKQTRFLEQWPVRYGVAVAAVGVGMLLRLVLADVLGEKVLFITFYPAVMLAAVLGGFRSGILATFLVALVVDLWLLTPRGMLALHNPSDVLALSLFCLMGVLMSGVAGLYRRTLRKSADYERELAVRESEERYRELVQNANSAIIRWGRDGKIAFFNEYAQTFFGYSQEEAVGREVSMLVPETESTGADLTTLLKDILDHPEKYVNNVNENILKDGRRVWMSWSNKPIFDENGQVAEILAVGSDITEQKHAQEALADSEAISRATLDAVQESIWMFDPNGVVLACNSGAATRLGRTPSETIGRTIYDLVSPELARSRWENIGKVFTTGRSLQWEDERDGMVFSHTVYPVTNDQGEISRVVIFSHDITESRLAEKHERELEAHRMDFYRRTIRAATDGKLIVCEREEIEAVECFEIGSWNINDLTDVATMRDDVVLLSRQAGMGERRLMDFLGCVVEAGSNAIKHAGRGKARLCRRDTDLICVISDSGPGIGALALPDVALAKGYSTAGTLGMGYKVMLRFADQVNLATGPDGTAVAIHMNLLSDATPVDEMVGRLAGWTD